MANRNNAPARKSALLLLVLAIALVLVAVYVFQRNRHDEPVSNSGKRGAPGSPARPKAPVNFDWARNNDPAIAYEGYTVGFNAPTHLASWAGYLLTKDQLDAVNAPRSNNFHPDNSVSSATDADYEGSGYDRGHLVPAEDLSYSAASMSASFYYTNMTPQVPAFNRGVWKRLEELVRYWAITYDSVYVVTGPVLREGLPAIGPHRVAVPQQFYKVILVYGSKGAQAIGFLINNEASTSPLRSFAVPVDEVERVTGIDLFYSLPDDVEEVLERDVIVNEWQWKREKKR